MKYLSFILTTCLILSAILFSSCSKDDLNEPTVSFSNYRYQLFKNLLDNNIEFDFLGTQVDNYFYPDYLGHSFDIDHEGIGAIQTEGVLNNLNSTLSSIETPDVALIGIGINDLVAGDKPLEVMRNLTMIIKTLHESNPDMSIFVEKVAPLRSDKMSIDLKKRIKVYNRMMDFMLSSPNFTDINVVVVDMNTNFLDSYFADTIHYNIAGAKFVANNYKEAILNNLENIENTDSINILPIGDSRVVGLRVRNNLFLSL